MCTTDVASRTRHALGSAVRRRPKPRGGYAGRLQLALGLLDRCSGQQGFAQGGNRLAGQLLGLFWHLQEGLDLALGMPDALALLPETRNNASLAQQLSSFYLF